MSENITDQPVQEVQGFTVAEVAAAMKSDIQGWGFGLLMMGLLSVFLNGVLDAGWGVVLIIASIPAFLIPKRGMFIVFGLILGLAGLMNLTADGAFKMFGLLQLYWAVQEFGKFGSYGKMLNEAAAEEPMAFESQPA